MSFLASPWIVVPGVGVSVFAIVYVNADRIVEWLKRQSLGQREYIIQRLDIMFVEVDPKRLTMAMLLMSFGLGFLALLLFWPNVTSGLLFGSLLTFVGWKIPKLMVDLYYAQRASRFVDQLVDGLTLMSNGLRSGLSLTQAMKIVVDNMPNPMAQEFELMLSQNALGVSIEEVMNELAKRIPYPDVQMFVTAVNILKDTGGNISETFDTIAKTVRERIKIEKKIAAVTAQGVMQGIIITATPFVLLIIMALMDPAYIKPLFSQTLGRIILIAMVALQIIGGLMIRKIVKIRV
ncbi:MAG: type II secretion system F family protein [Oligoflexia bacterium]|nr:type II secretion system F family protein [Oligoflexia bacterium]